MPAKKPLKKLKAEKEPAGMKLLGTLQGNGTDIFGIVFSPDGKTLASGSYGKTVLLWDVSTLLNTGISNGKEISILEGHTGYVYSVSFSPDGKVLASSGAKGGGTICLWDVTSKKEIGKFGKSSTGIYSVVFGPNGKILTSGYSDGTIRLWDVASKKEIGKLRDHSTNVYSVSFSPDGKILASGYNDGTIRLWDVASKKEIGKLQNHLTNVYSVSFSPDGKTLASGHKNGTIRLWDVDKRKLHKTLEMHTSSVWSCKFSPNGLLLASKSRDGTVRLWRTDTWHSVAILNEPNSQYFPPELAFHPTEPILATLEENDTVVRLWKLDYKVLLGKDFTEKPVNYTTAKIALLGDSGVGKTGLGWRLAHRTFKEHSSTHGQQFWVIDELGKTRTDGAECEAVLWDLAGQSDYRLVHSLFLSDVDLALLLFDPGNREKPLGAVSFWLKQLRQEHKELLKTMLVAARCDRSKPTLTVQELQDFCIHYNISGGYIPTSAKSGDGMEELLERLKALIPWDEMPATITSQTFKRIKEYVLKLKEKEEAKSVLLSPAQLRKQLKATDKDWEFSEAEMMTAVKHLENHGYVTVCHTSTGKRAILLFPDILVNLASSFVLEARGNTRGLGALEEEKLLAGGYKFPDIKGLKKKERETLLDAAAMLFLKQNICFRESLEGSGQRTFLVFPSLINEKRPKIQDIPTEEAASYHLTGAVENVYASLVVLLGYTSQFSRTNQWQDQAQYLLGENEICGFTQNSEHDGETELVLYFGVDTPNDVRLLFQGLFERFLKRREVAITRFAPLLCSKCGKRQERNVVMNLIQEGENALFCNKCGKKLTLPTAEEITTLPDMGGQQVTEGQEIADRRTLYETALVRVKTIHREQEERSPELQPPDCFISYAWGNAAQEKWVQGLAKDLSNAGIEVLFDKWHSTPGTDLIEYIERINSCEFVVVVGTPLLRQKYDAKNQSKVVKAELNMIGSRVVETATFGYKTIPLLLEGDNNTSLPPLLQTKVNVDFREQSVYFVQLFDLILTLYGIPFDHPGVDDLREELRQDIRKF